MQPADQQNLGQPLNEEGKKRKMNKMERKANKHSGAIDSFSLGQKSQIVSGYVAGGERKPTNCVFCIVFLFFIFGMITISIIGFTKGNYKALIAGVDSDGNICGYTPVVSNLEKTYYFLNTNNGEVTLNAACVSTCPQQIDGFVFGTDECHATGIQSCNIEPNQGYATTDILGFCVPKDIKENGFNTAAKAQYDKIMNNKYISQFYKDMQISQVAIFVCLGLAIVYTFIYLYLMSNCAHVLAYFAIGILELLFIAGMAGNIYGATQATQGKNGFYVGFGVIAFVFLIFNCMLWCYWSKLQIAIAVIDSTADFMVATKRIAFVTIYYFFISLFAVLIWGFGLIGVVSMSDITVEHDPDSDQYHKVINFTGATRFMTVAMFFCIIWILMFIREKTKFVYMISAAQFYFSSNANETGSASVVAGMAIANFKHSGSIALGSLLHTIVFILRIMVDALVDASESKAGRNGVVMCIGCLLKCFVSCLENLIEYLNTVAYAFMAISGDPYCKSAWNGFILNLKHLVKFYFADILASLFVIIGMLAISALNAGSFFLIVKYGTKNADQLSSVWVPMVFIILFTLITAELFIGFFHQAVTATLMCLAVDVELNGTVKHGSPSFHEKIDSVYGKYNDGAAQPEIMVHSNNNANTYHQVPQNQVYQSNQVNNTNNSMV